MKLRIALMGLVAGMLALAAPAHALEAGDAAKCEDLDILTVAQPNQPESIVRDCFIKLGSDKKFVAVDFASINCGPCVVSFPIYNRLAKTLADKMTTRTVLLDRDKNAAMAYVRGNTGYFNKHEVAFDNLRAATNSYEVMYTPTLFIIDENQKIVMKHIGSLDDEVVDQIKKLVNGNE
jgi:thiol-disulfide isomerase/thioredoxin